MSHNKQMLITTAAAVKLNIDRVISLVVAGAGARAGSLGLEVVQAKTQRCKLGTWGGFGSLGLHSLATASSPPALQCLVVASVIALF